VKEPSSIIANVEGRYSIDWNACDSDNLFVFGEGTAWRAGRRRLSAVGWVRA